MVFVQWVVGWEAERENALFEIVAVGVRSAHSCMHSGTHTVRFAVEGTRDRPLEEGERIEVVERLVRAEEEMMLVWVVS